MYQTPIARAARFTIAFVSLPVAYAQVVPVQPAPLGDEAPVIDQGETLLIDASSPPRDPLQDPDLEPMAPPRDTTGLLNGGSATYPDERDDPFRGTRPVHPITAPNYSVDPYITSDIRGTYINQQFPDNDLFAGGAVRVYDFQARYAFSDTTQVMISKLGSADVHFQNGKEFAATDIAVGLKHALLSDFEGRRHFAVGVGYEFGTGDEDAFGGDDEFRLFATYAQGYERLHLSGSVNYSIATGGEDTNGDSDRLSLHLHADYEMNDAFSPVVELNYYTVTGEGDPVTPVSGIDLANFGGNEDEDVMTVGIGGELRVIRDVKMRLAYESPLTDDEDLFGYRWTASAIWSF